MPAIQNTNNVNALMKIRKDLRTTTLELRNYGNMLPPASVRQKQKEVTREAVALMEKANARINEAIGWATEDIR